MSEAIEEAAPLPTRRVAFFGGSFDPPHMGHLLAATYVLSAGDVDELWIVPVYEHAFGKELTPFAHRLQMLKLAFEPLASVVICELEASLGGKSYTARTLRELNARHDDISLRLVIGTDLVDQVPTWREGASIPKLAPLLVVGRGEAGRAERAVGSPADSPEAALPISIPEVSSSDVRARLACGQSARGLVPKAVMDYIDDHQLYGSAT